TGYGRQALDVRWRDQVQLDRLRLYGFAEQGRRRARQMTQAAAHLQIITIRIARVLAFEFFNARHSLVPAQPCQTHAAKIRFSGKRRCVAKELVVDSSSELEPQPDILSAVGPSPSFINLPQREFIFWIHATKRAEGHRAPELVLEIALCVYFFHRAFGAAL